MGHGRSHHISNTVGNVFPAQVLTALEEAPGLGAGKGWKNTRKPATASTLVQEIRNLHQQCDFLLKSLFRTIHDGAMVVSP